MNDHSMPSHLDFASFLESDPSMVSLRTILEGMDRTNHSSPINEADTADQSLPLPMERLWDLERRYELMTTPRAASSMWSGDFAKRSVDLKAFRGESAYVWQRRDHNHLPNYILTYLYLSFIDHLEILPKLKEDRAFGVRVVEYEGKLLSRDLLDSVSEIYFLEEVLQLSDRRGFKVLDIGAGYGRFAHRLAAAIPYVEHVYCTDAVALSTFLCQQYLAFRDATSRCTAVPLDEMKHFLKPGAISLATNIHSFSEMPLVAIDAWISYIAGLEIPYLMVIPNAIDNGGTKLLSYEFDKTRRDFTPVLTSYGYHPVLVRPKFSDPFVQKHGISPTVYYFFERNGASRS